MPIVKPIIVSLVELVVEDNNEQNQKKCFTKVKPCSISIFYKTSMAPNINPSNLINLTTWFSLPSDNA